MPDLFLSSAAHDSQVETPGKVRQVGVPAVARTLSTLSCVDYEDAFLVDIGGTRERTGEQWARAVLEDAPIAIRRQLGWGWFALGLKLDLTWSGRCVLGWEVRPSTLGTGVAPTHRLVVPYLLKRASRAGRREHA